MSSKAYNPSSSLEKWLEKRLPIISVVHHFTYFPTPRNLNYMWTFGGILFFFLFSQIITGLILTMHYTADSGLAFSVLEKIMRDVNFGWMFRYLHANGASFFFVAVYLHILRGIYYGSYKSPREVLWILGVIIFLVMMATAFTGYILPWGQMSFWAATVITNLFSAIPLVGPTIVEWLQGGFAVTGVTLNRFFALHFLMPFLIFGLVILHVWSLHVVGNNNPEGIDVAEPEDTVSFSPYYTYKDLFAVLIIFLVFSWFVFFNPTILGHPDNYIPANPLVTPPHIVPEWYFLPFYAILRAIPYKLPGVIALFGSIVVVALLPWLDSSKVRSARYRPIFKIFFWVFLVSGVGLGWIGSQPPNRVLLESSSVKNFETNAEAKKYVAADPQNVGLDHYEIHKVINWKKNQVEYDVKSYNMRFEVLHLGQILTLIYFMFFVSLPVISRIEKAKVPPQSIAYAMGLKS